MLHRGVKGTYWMNDPTQSPRTLLDNTLDACRRALCARSSVRRLTFGARTLPRAPKYNRSMVDAALLAEAKRLSPDDRLELISALWQSLSPDQLPVTDAEKLMLDERLAELRANPSDERDWADAEASLQRRLA